MAKIKKKSSETFTDDDIKVVKWMLKTGKTKKDCCEFLKISYNTKRLASIIEEYDERIKRTAELKKKNRDKVFTDAEKNSIVSEYNSGTSMAKVAEMFYVSAPRIKKILMEKNVPIRGRGKKIVKVDHIVQDKSIKLNIGDEVYFAPKPFYESDTAKAFVCEPGKAKIIHVYDESLCELWDAGIEEERVIIDPKVNFESKSFQKAWPNGPVEHQHYKVEYKNVEGHWWERSILETRYHEELDYSIKYGEDTYIIQFLDDTHSFRQYFATRNELFPVEVLGKNES